MAYYVMSKLPRRGLGSIITHEFFHSKTTVRGSLRQLVFDKRCGTVYYPDVSGS